MILCDHGGSDQPATEDVLLFTAQLNKAGVNARMAIDLLPADAKAQYQYEAAPFLCDPQEATVSKYIILAADRLSADKMEYIRRLDLPPTADIYALGEFTDTQTRINTLSKLSYVLGTDPELVNLLGKPDLKCANSIAFGVNTPAKYARKKPVVLLLGPNLEESSLAQSIYTLSLSRKFDVLIVCNGKSKESWRKTFGYSVPVYHYGELLPADISAKADICVMMSPLQANIRAKSIRNNMIVSGHAIISSLPEVMHKNDFAVQGPINPEHLAGFITREVLPNITDIGRSSQNSATAAEVSISRLIELLELPVNSPKKTGVMNKTLFVPTNGVGLGHAQRCSLVADAMQDRESASFAAFPSCLPMLNRYGFDGIPLVSRSPEHLEPHANDLLNYLRLSSATDTGGHLVFDGGYVFDSIFRTIANNHLRSTWIRRGLWQAGQQNNMALDREKIFDQVIVPMEAFEELNASYSYGNHLKSVGPIVQHKELVIHDRKSLRTKLGKRFGIDFDHLVVTMLGGGVAADRTAQVQAICSEIERRKNTLNLVVTWPTAKVDPGWFVWKNSRIVRTHHANPLVQASDLFISAVGYNSFHEALYNRVPAIFIPQMAAYMDDQRARAEAAQERGAGIVVEPDQLMTLGREISACLDGGKAENIRGVLGNLNLPETGNRSAARYIEELTNAG